MGGSPRTAPDDEVRRRLADEESGTAPDDADEPTSDEDGDHPSSHLPLLPISRAKPHRSPPRRYRRSSKGGKHAGGSEVHRLDPPEVLLQLATLFVLLLVALVGLGTCGWVGWFMYTRHNAFAHAVFSPSLRPLPRRLEPGVKPFNLGSNASLSIVQSELDTRLLSLSLPPSTLACPSLSSPSSVDSNSTFANRYSQLSQSGPYLVALNLYNSQDVLPTLAKTLLALADFLGTRNVYISIFENGSRDNTTLALAHLAAALTSFKVEHTIVSDPRTTDWSRVDRIDQLAIYRNVALEPVSRGLDGRNFEDVLFINDVFAGPTDALELLLQRREQDADAACAMDWRETKGSLSRWGAQSVKMYDNWVTRSIHGNMLRPRLDVFSESRHGVEELFAPGGQDEPSRDRLKRGLPIPVYSCWNGMLAMTSEPFRTTGINPRTKNRDGPLGVLDTTLRASTSPTTFRTALNSAGECAASECKTIAKDFWSRGYNRWIIVPTVHVTYKEFVYSHPHLLEIVSAARDFLATESTRLFTSVPAHLSPRIDWSLPEWTAPKSVVCWSWARGFHIDLPGWRSTREKAWK
ncbi:hypothetical protein JCM11491_003953 [Sporobolomyces phaffii]